MPLGEFQEDLYLGEGVPLTGTAGLFDVGWVERDLCRRRFALDGNTISWYESR
jgi:hypothetical protein